jgi:transcriptional regulator with XRE-family HTH domain
MGELGTRLIRAREARGLTLEDAERDTRISRRYLEALESEQLENIPAPVYARGFLRSYSQYLGMDPQEMLALFPRDDEVGAPQPPRASMQNPVPPTSPSRPAWRRPSRTRPDERSAPPPSQPAPPPPARARRPQPPQRPPAALPQEPMIGVDIGVPAPARRINPGHGDSGRNVAILIAAGIAVLIVVIAALVISNLGDDGGTALPGENGTPTGTAGTPTVQATTPVNVTRGVVPDVEGLDAPAARAEIEAAGFVVRENRTASQMPAGRVLTQSPAAGIAWPEGNEVIIVVSTGP